MDDAGAVRGFEGLANLPEERRRLVRRELAAVAQPARQVRAVHVFLQHVEQPALRATEAINTDDARMTQPGHEAGLAFKPRRIARILPLHERRRQHLHGHRAAQRRLHGFEDGPHAAATEEFGKAELRQRGLQFLQ